MLINLTNHPLSRWSDKQKAAAEVYGEIVDLPFPIIDETGDETYIKSLVEDYFQRIIKLSEGKSVFVHLMGEMTFTFALVALLLRHNIICLSSTTKRIVQTDESGAKKEVVFQFERFRRFEL